MADESIFWTGFASRGAAIDCDHEVGILAMYRLEPCGAGLRRDEVVPAWAKDRPEQTAMEGDDLAFTFAQLDDATARVAARSQPPELARHGQQCTYIPPGPPNGG